MSRFAPAAAALILVSVLTACGQEKEAAASGPSVAVSSQTPNLVLADGDVPTVVVSAKRETDRS